MNAIGGDWLQLVGVVVITLARKGQYLFVLTHLEISVLLSPAGNESHRDPCVGTVSRLTDTVVPATSVDASHRQTGGLQIAEIEDQSPTPIAQINRATKRVRVGNKEKEAFPRPCCRNASGARPLTNVTKNASQTTGWPARRGPF